MWTTITVDHKKYESMKRQIEVLKSIDNDKFCRFIEFINWFSDEINIKWYINNFIEDELSKYRDLESNIELW